MSMMLLRSHSSSRLVSPCHSHSTAAARTSSRLQWLPRQRGPFGALHRQTPAVAASSSSASEPPDDDAVKAWTPPDVEWDAQWPDVEVWRRCLVANVPTYVELVRGVSFDGRQVRACLRAA
jgi:hypothetical protein